MNTSMNFAFLFLAAFCINLLYELAHSWLYETCRRATLSRCVLLVLKGALFDATVITAMWIVAFLVFPNAAAAVTLFIAMALALAWTWEAAALGSGRWQYAREMPLLFGVGLTPLVQLAATGLLAMYIVRYF